MAQQGIQGSGVRSEEKLKVARARVNELTFGTAEWEAAMAVVRTLSAELDAAAPAEEFCSVDSGVHRTRLLSGRIV
jgi:hypothetical protein